MNKLFIGLMILCSACNHVPALELRELWAKELPYSCMYNVSNNGMIGITNELEHLIMNEKGEDLFTIPNDGSILRVADAYYILFGLKTRVFNYQGDLLWTFDKPFYASLSQTGDYILFTSYNEDEYYIYSWQGKLIGHFKDDTPGLEFLSDDKYFFSESKGVYKLEDDQLTEFILREKEHGNWKVKYLPESDRIAILDNSLRWVRLYNHQGIMVWEKAPDSHYGLSSIEDHILLYSSDSLQIINPTGEVIHQLPINGFSDNGTELKSKGLRMFQHTAYNEQTLEYKADLYFMNRQGTIVFQSDWPFSASVTINQDENLLFSLTKSTEDNSTKVLCYEIGG